ncbi:MAG: hypothetical protein IIZ92_14130 [Aquincola sp.]|nr:hypothetical protein [Aquincola sp.]
MQAATRWHIALFAAGVAALIAITAGAETAAAADEAAGYVQFVEDFTANCVARNGVQLQVRNTHPSRKIRVWLDRIQMGVGTGDRSRTELPPGAEPEPLGCSRTLTGTQEWRLVRAQFVD